jgi:hypothetical protein
MADRQRHREPKVRGCGTGDITDDARDRQPGRQVRRPQRLFVGMCRAVGVPARDVYGLRVAPSAFGYRELGANPANLRARSTAAPRFLRQYGWVAMDPADVLKVMRQETPDWIKDPQHPLVAPVAQGPVRQLGRHLGRVQQPRTTSACRARRGMRRCRS